MKTLPGDTPEIEWREQVMPVPTFAKHALLVDTQLPMIVVISALNTEGVGRVAAGGVAHMT
jgi:hypothetical protein